MNEPRCLSYNHAAKVECELPPDHDGSHLRMTENGVIGWPNHKALTYRKMVGR